MMRMGNRNLSQLFSFDTKYFRLRYKGALPSYRFRLDFHLTVKFPIISFNGLPRLGQLQKNLLLTLNFFHNMIESDYIFMLMFNFEKFQFID